MQEQEAMGPIGTGAEDFERQNIFDNIKAISEASAWASHLS